MSRCILVEICLYIHIARISFGCPTPSLNNQPEPTTSRLPTFVFKIHNLGKLLVILFHSCHLVSDSQLSCLSARKIFSRLSNSHSLPLFIDLSTTTQQPLILINNFNCKNFLEKSQHLARCLLPPSSQSPWLLSSPPSAHKISPLAHLVMPPSSKTTLLE